MIRKWRLTSCSSITINRNLKLDTSLLSDDQANSEDELQRYKTTAKAYSMDIPVVKTKILDFKGRIPFAVKSALTTKLLSKLTVFDVTMETEKALAKILQITTEKWEQ
jgi:hypothetical protein